MVEIGVVRVPVCEGRMPVPMAVRLARWVFGAVRVLVVFVVDVPVLVFERLVAMRMIVGFGEVQIDAN